MTDTALALPGWRHIYSGKVRNLYEPEESSPGTSATLLVVATDRISAFDHILAPGIPEKGKILTQLSLWWFDRLADEFQLPNHVVSTDVPAAVAGRAMIVKRLEMLPIEAIARGYLTGSGLAEYRQNGTVTGIQLPTGLEDGSKLEPAIFTPSAKAAVGDHDENISFAEMTARIGSDTAEAIRDKTLQLYTTAERIARESGIILADTKVDTDWMNTGLSRWAMKCSLQIRRGSGTLQRISPARPRTPLTNSLCAIGWLRRRLVGIKPPIRHRQYCPTTLWSTPPNVIVPHTVV